MGENTVHTSHFQHCNHFHLAWLKPNPPLGRKWKAFQGKGKGSPQQRNTPPTRMWDPMWVAVTMGRHAVRYGVKV